MFTQFVNSMYIQYMIQYERKAFIWGTPRTPRSIADPYPAVFLSADPDPGF